MSQGWEFQLLSLFLARVIICGDSSYLCCKAIDARRRIGSGMCGHQGQKTVITSSSAISQIDGWSILCVSKNTSSVTIILFKEKCHQLLTLTTNTRFILS